MPLTKEQKSTAVDDIVAMLEETPTVYLTNYQGLSVDQATDLRDRFKERGVQYKVLKNTLLKRALERIGGYDELYDHLSGPTAVAFTTDAAAPAKVIKKFNKDAETELPELKAAFIDGSVYQSDALDMLEALKSKEELIGDVIMLLQSPMKNVVGSIQSVGSNLVGIVKAIAEKAEA